MQKLTRYKPEIVTAATGRHQACMQTCENGAWIHYKEVEKLLAKKDKEIARLKRGLILGMKLVNASTDMNIHLK